MDCLPITTKLYHFNCITEACIQSTSSSCLHTRCSALHQGSKPNPPNMCNPLQHVVRFIAACSFTHQCASDHRQPHLLCSCHVGCTGLGDFALLKYSPLTYRQYRPVAGPWGGVLQGAQLASLLTAKGRHAMSCHVLSPGQAGHVISYPACSWLVDR